ncbi:hypothetical protein SAY86_013673 [Trapa natans]|uniref:Protein kinase domain-containing protein n=1 Tax=Trapa natans TaxID=22666 RepID=A0AAN7KM40_TRANT|nr:hypothetical protein SAY86_013673 [Trapa natans]
MGISGFCVLVVLSWSLFLLPMTHELQLAQTRVLLQLKKYLEYPSALDVWPNDNGDFCSIKSSPRLSLTCAGNSVTELKIMGDKIKPSKLTEFNGYAVSNQTLSADFSMDSFITTLTRLTSLRVLSLVSLGIWGSIPDKIHRLESLEFLDLSSNYLFGAVPGQISRLENLQVLAFNGNFLNGTLPDGLDSLSNLTDISLKNNRLVGQFPQSVSRISTLATISLSKNKLSGKLPDLGGLAVLHVLDLIGNHFNSNLPIFPKGMVSLLLSQNLFSGIIPEQLAELNQLQHLDVSFNLLTGTPAPEIFSLPNISYIDLSSNTLSGSLSGDLHCGSKLGFVDISNNKLVGQLPSCLSSAENKAVKFGGNCLSINGQGQHDESYCKEKETARKRYILGAGLGVLIAVIGGAALVISILALGLICFCLRTRSEKKTFVQQHHLPKIGQENPLNGMGMGMSSDFLANARLISEAAKAGTQIVPRLFSLNELREATKDFHPSNLIGEGSIGKLYKGRLESGAHVTVRSLALKRCSIHNLRVRLDWLSKLQHPHLVGLLGHCVDGEDSTAKVFLVYEFVSGGNYRTHLSESFPEKVFKWSDRLAVLIGVAKAVHFLHTGVIPGSSNNRLTTSNILLDEHHIAKLSDYGMCILNDEFEKVEAKGDVHKSSSNAKLEDDVYNFGFILLESLVGPIVTGKGEAFLLNEMASFGSQDGRRRIVDPIVLTTSSQESLTIVISITNKCISPDPSSRPSFEDVLWNLQYAAQVQAAADMEQRSDATSQS